MPIVFTPMPTAIARAHQAGCPDANGQTPERGVSDGSANPCRHCLGFVPAGAGMLILAYRPFLQPQPYAELGPIFLCADPLTCHAPAPSGVPPRMLGAADYIIRGYCRDNRIVYGTGAVVPTRLIVPEAEARLADPRVAYIHVRSARNNCYQLRIDRA